MLLAFENGGAFLSSVWFICHPVKVIHANNCCSGHFALHSFQCLFFEQEVKSPNFYSQDMCSSSALRQQTLFFFLMGLICLFFNPLFCEDERLKLDSNIVKQLCFVNILCRCRRLLPTKDKKPNTRCQHGREAVTMAVDPAWPRHVASVLSPAFRKTVGMLGQVMMFLGETRRW